MPLPAAVASTPVPAQERPISITTVTHTSAARAFTIGFTEGHTSKMFPDGLLGDRPPYAALHARLEGVPVVTVLGSHKDELKDAETGEKFRTVTDASRTFLSGICQTCVTENVSMQNGGAKTGFMGEASVEFVEARDAIGAANTTSQLVLQPLRFLSDATNEPPSTLGSTGFVSNSHGSFLTRTGGMYGVGVPVMNVLFPGGLGLAEEFFLGPAAATTGNRCYGPYHRRGIPDYFVVASDTLEGRIPQGYYGGFEQFVDFQQKVGLMRPDVANRFYFTKLADAKEEAALLAPWIKRGTAVAAKPEVTGRLESEARRQLLVASRRGEEVRKVLEESMRNSGPSFLPVFLSHVYAEFLARRAERAAGNLVSGVVKQLADESIGLYRELCNFLIHTEQRPTVQLVGFNKSLGPNHQKLQAWFQKFADTLAAGSADRDFDFMVTGDGMNGIQQGTFAAWEDRASAKSAAGRPAKSRYVRVQMDLDGEVTSALSGQSGLKETLLPPMVSLESTAALVSLVGRPKVYVVCCPGPVEMYREVMSTLLYRQLSKMVLNGFMDLDKLPKVIMVSPSSKSIEGCWFDGLRVQFKTFERFGATYPGNFDGVEFMKFGEESNLMSATVAARSVLQQISPEFEMAHAA